MSRTWITCLAVVCLVAIGSAALCTTIGEAKLAAVGTSVTVTGCVTSVEAGECYIEAADRAAGIWVQGSTSGIGIGQMVTVTGAKSMIDGEAVLTNSSIWPNIAQAEIAPFSLNNRWIGGSAIGTDPGILDYKPAWGTHSASWLRAYGPNNTGLLVRTWGTVSSTYSSPTTNSNWFYIDDGTKAFADLGDTGVLVFSDASVKQGDFVAVTGISSVTPANDGPVRRIRVIRTRGADDVQVVRVAQKPEQPFSDEFDGTTLDSRWTYIRGTSIPDTGSVTLDGHGSLVMSAPARVLARDVKLLQHAPGDWDMDMKLHVTLTQFHPTNVPYAAVGLTAGPEDQSVWPQVWIEPATGALRIYLNWSITATVPGDTCYLHFERRSQSLKVSVSDGNAYIRESTAAVADGLLMMLAGSDVWSSALVICDYVRFTQVNP